MKIFRLRANPDNYQFIQLVDEDEWHVLNHMIAGTRPLSDWRAFDVVLAKHGARGKTLLPSDFPGFDAWAVFSQRAVDQLRRELTDRGRFLPLRCSEGTYVVFHPTVVIDALDEANSQISRFSSGRVMAIEAHRFLPSKVSDAFIFRLPQLASGPTYVTEAFVERVHAAELRGFKFEPVGQS